MTQEAAVPPGLLGRIQKMIDDSIAKFARSGFLRNASITGGATTISSGGALRLVGTNGQELLYLGSMAPNLPDGTPQSGAIIRRSDGTLALAMYDSNPADGLDQFLAWWDRGTNIVVSDDTNSGSGLARPYVPVPLLRSRYTDLLSVTDGAFVDVFDTGFFYKVNATARATIRCTTDVTGTTGEVRVLVDNVQVGATQAVGFQVDTKYVGPFAVPGSAYSQHTVKVQARRTAGTGAVRVDAQVWGMQS